LQIPCHKYNLKPSLIQYIYPISYKIAKRATPVNEFAFFLKRYRPDTLSLFYVCADNSGHLHHVDRLAFFQI
jgi:hypothetical protein